MKTIAQIDFGTIEGLGPLGKPQGTGILNFASVVSTAIGLMTLVAFIWFVFNFIIGAIGIMTAGGDKQKLESSRQKIVNGIIGVVVVIAAIFVIDVIGTIFGIPFLNIFQLFYLLIPGGGNNGGYPPTY